MLILLIVAISSLEFSVKHTGYKRRTVKATTATSLYTTPSSKSYPLSRMDHTTTKKCLPGFVRLKMWCFPKEDSDNYEY